MIKSYILYYVYTPVQSVNYCDRLGRRFRFVCVYACTAVFLCCYGFSVNKDLYINAESSHSEHLLWHCLPGIPVTTHHNRFFQSHWRQPTTGSF